MNKSPVVFLPELLSPAGNWECARAAVANGADAIFFGLATFNARMRADNFTHEDLPELMAFLHQHGVKGYCAFNVLIFTDELEMAAEEIRRLEAAGVDALIVQDVGVAALVKEIAPRIRLHASTQMTLTSPEGLKFAKQLGIDQAVLARELSLRDLEKFRALEDSSVPLEVFVHGALCVAYSGQCLTSESLGQRSANRGECAQACRMPYQMIVDGEEVDLQQKQYLLSPQDLAAVNEIPRLIELGIKSFKIEGRLKTPEYVAAVTRVYRTAIDAALAKVDPQSVLSAEDWYDLEMTFSRGLYTGWMHGVNHQELVGAYYGKKRGTLLGKVDQWQDNAVLVKGLPKHVKAGDGVVFENLNNTNDEYGARILAVDGEWILLPREKRLEDKLREGQRIFKTGDQAMNARLRRSFEKENLPVRHKKPWYLKVEGKLGEKLRVSDVRESTMGVESQVILQKAEKHSLSAEVVKQQLGRLGGTSYELVEIEWQVEDGLMLPVSELNRMRRSLVEQWDQQEKNKSKPIGLLSAEVVSIINQKKEILREERCQAMGELSEASELTVLCRTEEQMKEAVGIGVQTLYLDFEDIRRYADAVTWVKDHSASEVFLATPRIQKAGESGFFKLIERSMPHGVLVRNLGGIDYFKSAGLICDGDFSLNIANPLSAKIFHDLGLRRLTISYDLNVDQVLAMLRQSPPNWYSLTIHQHMPMFHMEHCVFAAFLSEGKDFNSCGRPCEKHQVKLRDRVGMEHPLKADVGCRNTLFNAVAQTGAQYFMDMERVGLKHYRLELLEESGVEAKVLIETYQQLLKHERQGQDLWKELKAKSQLGVTKGTLRNGQWN
jgi:putative protease